MSENSQSPAPKPEGLDGQGSEAQGTDSRDPCGRPAAAVEPKRCRCGYTKGHHMVAKEREYGPGGWIALLFGVSAKARRTFYRCAVCKDVVHEDES